MIPSSRARRITLAVLAVAASMALASPCRARQGTESSGFVRWQAALRALAPDPERGADVTDLVLERDAATLHLGSGRLHALDAIDGRTVGLVFVGSGRFTLSAPVPVEQDQLRRAFESAELDEEIRTAVILFTDPTMSELEQSLTWTAMEPPRDARREVEEAMKYITDDDGWAARDVMAPLLNAVPGFFYAHVAEDRGDPMIFEIDPYSFEEISLARRTPRGERRDLVARFHRAEDYASGTSVPEEALDALRVLAYDIETLVEGNLDIRGRATLQLQRNPGHRGWIPFSLFSELRVDSIHWGDGTPATYARPQESADLWVDFTRAPVSTSLTVHYHGDLMDRPENLWVQLKSQTTWFPVYASGRAIPYRLTFHVPDEYTVTTVGSRVSEEVDDDVVTTVWETPPVREMTFNIGEFDEHASTDARAPALTVLVNERAHRTLNARLGERGIFLLEQRDMGEVVAADLANSFAFYDQVYGPSTVDRFVATEIPFNHGTAYTGLVLLSWSTFQWTSDEGFDEMFRAHEVAHQWWGIGVRPASYHDWWLAEGFSEFSGWWYAARVRGSVDMYLRRLKVTREELLKRRSETAPIWLGTRVATSEHPEDYANVVYHKGAWVLHMLRTLLTDPDEGGDALFGEVMKTFFSEFRGRTASTEQFQATVERVVGADLSWFFRQWVYGSDIPTYTFSHTYEDLPDGQVKATVRVRQERVPDDFSMIVPVLLDFGEEGMATVRLNVTGPETEAELPLLPRRPDRIELNAFEAVLAETKTERWRER